VDTGDTSGRHALYRLFLYTIWVICLGSVEEKGSIQVLFFLFTGVFLTVFVYTLAQATAQARKAQRNTTEHNGTPAKRWSGGVV